MASSGSRKRRHKSKEKIPSTNQGSLTETEENEQQQQQQQQQHQQVQQQLKPQQQQLPEEEGVEEGQMNRKPLLACILDRFFLSRPSESGNTEDGMSRVVCLSMAASIGHVDGVRKLLDEQLDVNARSKDCFTALQSAVSWKHQEIAEMLLQKGASVADTTEAGQNSLMLAAYNGDVSMMDLLWTFKETSLEINAADKEGVTALHLCAQASSKEGVAFLLSRGADGRAKNKQGRTALHIAAKQGDIETCDLLITHLNSIENEPSAKVVLCEDAVGKTPICEAMGNQHLMVVKILMDVCNPEETFAFYMRRVHKLASLPSTTTEPAIDIQPVLGSLLLVVKRLQRDFLREMSGADPIRHLVQAIRLHVTSPRVLSTACLLISVLIWRECSCEDPNCPDLNSGETEDSLNAHIRDELLQQFLDCRGPDAVMEKLSTPVFTAHDTYIVVSTLLPVMILASRTAGRAWLEHNSGNLSFYKDLLTRNKAFITHINLSNHMGHGLQVGHVIKTFLGFVEEIEAKDREQNLAELLEEEERDRLKREKKKRKRQKKHNKQAKLDTTSQNPVTDGGSSDDETGENAGWNDDSCVRGTVGFQSTGDVPESKERSQVYYQQKKLQQQQHSEYPLLPGTHSRPLANTLRKAFPSEACLAVEKLHKGDAKWRQPEASTEEFPPISGGSEDRTTSDTSEGWVKVEGRKQSGRNTPKHNTVLLSSRPSKLQESSRPAPMRWADVAKIGCSRVIGSRNLTVLLGDVGRNSGTDHSKMSVLSRSNDLKSANSPEGDELRERSEEGVEDWQQIARSAFEENMASKEQETEDAAHTTASSDCDSDEESSSSSSESPTRVPNVALNRKKSLSVVDDFTSLGTNLSKSPKTGSMDSTLVPHFRDFRDDPRSLKLYHFENNDVFESKDKERRRDGETLICVKRQFGDKNHHSNEEKLIGNSWNWSETKPGLQYQPVWGLMSRAKSVEGLDASSCPLSERAESHQGTVATDETYAIGAANYPRSQTPTYPSVEQTQNNTVTTIEPTSVYMDPQHEAFFLKKSRDIAERSRLQFALPTQNSIDGHQIIPGNQWEHLRNGQVQSEAETKSWQVKNRKLNHAVSTTESDGWEDASDAERNNQILRQKSAKCLVPNFANTAHPVENSAIVTSMVESVLTPTVTSLANLDLSGKLSTRSNKLMRMPSPPPGFNVPKPSSTRMSNINPSFNLLTKLDVSSTSADQDANVQNVTTPVTSDQGLEYDSIRQTDKSLQFGTPRSRSPMVGIVGPFSKTSSGSEDNFSLQQQQRQHLHLQTLTSSSFNRSSSSYASGSIMQNRTGSGAVKSVFGLPVGSSQVLLGGNWMDRSRPSVSAINTPVLSPYTSIGDLSNLGEFSVVLNGRLQQRQSLRHQDGLQSSLKRVKEQHPQPQQCQDLKSFQDAMDVNQRRYNEHMALQLQQQQQHQRQQQYYSLAMQQQTQNQARENAMRLNTQQQKQQLNLLYQRQQQQQLCQRLQTQQRQPSPPVLFPSDLRDEPEPRASEKHFPAFHDATSSDLLSDLLSDPMLIEKIAISQIRQQYLTYHGSHLTRDNAMTALRDSVYCNDLEYYASLYRVKLKDLLLKPNQLEHRSNAPEQVFTDRICGSTNRQDFEKQGPLCPRNHGNMEGHCVSPDREGGVEKNSRRWRDALNKILDTQWTMRRQYGDIVLPSTLSDYNISLMEYPLVLGYTTDGCEVAVLILDKSQACIDPCLLDIICDPELDHHFILKCKGISETCTTQYAAMELCDYTLAEYMQIVQLSHRQDPLSANRLAWQLLEGLKFIHQHLGMPHRNLKPSWIFVDAEGRLRLGGYGIVTRQTGIAANAAGSNVDRNETGRTACWTSSEDLVNDQAQSSMASDIQVAGMLLYFILTGGQHPFGATPLEAEVNLVHTSSHLEHISEEANDLVSGMLFPDPASRPNVEHCLKHPFFWSSEKKFRLILIVGSDVLTEMKTGIALTGNGSPTMMEILSVHDITEVSPNWVQAINPTVMKEMRSFRVYKNSLSELTLFIYNCCLHFDKMSAIAKEVLDDPCKYFESLFPPLFMAIYRSLKASDRTDRTCYKPFF